MFNSVPRSLRLIAAVANQRIIVVAEIRSAIYVGVSVAEPDVALAVTAFLVNQPLLPNFCVFALSDMRSHPESIEILKGPPHFSQ